MVEARDQVRAGLLPRVHHAPVAGAAPDVRRVAGHFGDRPHRSCSAGIRADAGADSRSRCSSSTFACPVRSSRNGTLWLLSGFLLMNLLVLLEVADRLSLKRDLEVAREIQQRDAARGHVVRARRRGVRLDEAGQHRRRRLLRHPAATRWHRARRARRRRRQGQPRGAADGAAARHPPHARRRRPAAAGARASVSTCRSSRHAPGVAIHHACSSPRYDRQPDVSSSSTPARHLRCCAGKMERSNG